MGARKPACGYLRTAVMIMRRATALGTWYPAHRRPSALSNETPHAPSAWRRPGLKWRRYRCAAAAGFVTSAQLHNVGQSARHYFRHDCLQDAHRTHRRLAVATFRVQCACTHAIWTSRLAESWGRVGSTAGSDDAVITVHAGASVLFVGAVSEETRTIVYREVRASVLDERLTPAISIASVCWSAI